MYNILNQDKRRPGVLRNIEILIINYKSADLFFIKAFDKQGAFSMPAVYCKKNGAFRKKKLTAV